MVCPTEAAKAWMHCLVLVAGAFWWLRWLSSLWRPLQLDGLVVLVASTSWWMVQLSGCVISWKGCGQFYLGWCPTACPWQPLAAKAAACPWQPKQQLAIGSQSSSLTLAAKAAAQLGAQACHCPGLPLLRPATAQAYHCSRSSGFGAGIAYGDVPWGTHCMHGLPQHGCTSNTRSCHLLSNVLTWSMNELCLDHTPDPVLFALAHRGSDWECMR